MAEHTPTTETVRDCFVDGAAGDFIEEDFDRWLAAHDAELRAEVERLRALIPDRDGGPRGCSLRYGHDADCLAGGPCDVANLLPLVTAYGARQQVADLQAGIEAAVTVLNREFYRRPSTWVERLAADLRALLAGSGEQPGEVTRVEVRGRGYGKTQAMAERVADAVKARGLPAEVLPAPVVPDGPVQEGS